jgi:hypothetical protein
MSAKVETIPVTISKSMTYLMAGMVQACCICDPGDSIFKRFPHLRDLGLVISHGYCKSCAAKLRLLDEQNRNKNNQQEKKV